MSSEYVHQLSFKSKPTNIAPNTDILGLSDCKLLTFLILE